MCGICGFVYDDPARPVEASVLTAMRDSMAYRGPDDAGIYTGPGVGLGSRRLAIIDLSERGHMPMNSRDGRYWITYNGEVYNYRELRRELEGRGYAFHSNTDTEVLLYLYIDRGPAMLDRLNGMFAIAVWDSHERRLFLARDRLGIKPVYWAQRDGAFYFASEQKALFEAGIAREFDSSCWEELLCFHYVAGERCSLEGIRRLLPGQYLIWEGGRLTTRRWWDYPERVRALRQESQAEPYTWFQQTFDAAVDLRRISDVPVGVLLSGGLDSSSVAASLALQAESRVSSFTVRFSHADYDEGPVAATVAERWQLDPHELTIDDKDLVPLLLETSRLQDEPLAHVSALHLFSISKYAKPLVTVLLSGEGSDEVLGGYTRYRPLLHPRLLNLSRAALPALVGLVGASGRWRKLARFLELGSIDDFVLYNACDVLPEDLRGLGMNPTGELSYRRGVFAEARALYPQEPFRQAMYHDQFTHLTSIMEETDRMTMGASIECRVPFLDFRIVERMAATPSAVLLAGKRHKPLLRRALGSRLPQAVLDHRKWGFGVPWKRYLRTNPALREVVEALPDREPFLSGPFERAKLRAVVREFLGEGERHDPLMMQLTMIAMWHQAVFEGAPVPAH